MFVVSGCSEIDRQFEFTRSANESQISRPSPRMTAQGARVWAMRPPHRHRKTLSHVDSCRVASIFSLSARNSVPIALAGHIAG
jgi:hypothetical protein